MLGSRDAAGERNADDLEPRVLVARRLVGLATGFEREAVSRGADRMGRGLVGECDGGVHSAERMIGRTAKRDIDQGVEGYPVDRFACGVPAADRRPRLELLVEREIGSAGSVVLHTNRTAKSAGVGVFAADVARDIEIEGEADQAGKVVLAKRLMEGAGVVRTDGIASGLDQERRIGLKGAAGGSVGRSAEVPPRLVTALLR